MSVKRPTLSLRWQVLVFMVLRLAVNTNTRMIYPFLAVFARGLGVDITTISLALTARFLTGAASPLLAPVADIHGRKVSMLLGMSIFTLSMLIVVLWPSYPIFFLSIVLSLLGMYIYLPAMQAYLGDAILYKERGQALAITELGWSLSFILGIPLVGLLIARYGWRAPFPLLAAAGLGGIAMIVWLIPELPPKEPGGPGFWQNARGVLSYPPAMAALLFSLAFTAANEVVTVMFGVWMEDSFGLKIAALGMASAAIGFAELGGEGLSAWIVDRVGKERSVAAGLILNSMVALALPFLGRSLTGGVIGLGLFFLTFEFAIVSSLSLMTEVMPGARATLMGLNIAAFALGRAAGSFFGPQLYHLGFLANGVSAALVNVLSLLALSRVKLDKR
jgi:predicted MFS family arabinose efflux permease